MLFATEPAKGYENMVEAHWDGFANQIHDQFEQIETEILIEAKSLLLNSRHT